MAVSNNQSNRLYSETETAIGCLLFPILFFSLVAIGMFILTYLSEVHYRHGEVPDRGFLVLVYIPGNDRPNDNEITEWGWRVDQKDYLDEKYPGWSFYEPVRSGSIKTGEFSSIRWSVEEVSTTRKRIELQWRNDDGSLFSTYEIEKNQITPVSLEYGLNPGYVMASLVPALIISIFLCSLLKKLSKKTSRKMPPQYQLVDE